jgi:hypothetical protein
MSLVIKSFTAEAGHWYTKDGEPAYTIIGANGKERNTTLRDARKLNLLPSVTTILNIAAKPGLDVWKQKQVLMSALTLPRNDGESESDYIDRIVRDSREEGKSAADFGTEIHANIQQFYEGRPYDPKHEAFVKGCNDILNATFGSQTWDCERSFSHELGFGGKVDMHCEDFIVDIKTREFTDVSDVAAYDGELMQLAAYRAGLGLPNARCANVYISRNVPSLCTVKEWSEDDVKRGWKMFLHLLQFWQIKNNYEG